jgi:predicted RND superfamily exporter protein
LRERGVPLREAIERAGEVRFLPVLLTSLTAIGGLSPLAFENSPLYSPLAMVLIGGLISSTLIARIVTPASTCCRPPKTRRRSPLEKIRRRRRHASVLRSLESATIPGHATAPEQVDEREQDQRAEE